MASEEEVQQLTLKVTGAAEVKRLSEELRNNERDILRVADAYIEGSITEKQYQVATAQLASEYKLFAEQMEVAKLAVKGLTPEMVAAAKAAADLERMAAQGFAGVDRGGKASEAAAGRVRNMGAAANQASYMFQDLMSTSGDLGAKLSSVTNNVSMLAMQLGAPGMLAGGLMAVSVGAIALYRNWDSLAGLFTTRNPFPEATNSLQAMEEALKKNHSALEALHKQTSLSNSELAEFNKLTKEGADLEARVAMMRDLERAKKEPGKDVAGRKAEIERVIKEEGGGKLLKDVQDALVARYGTFGKEADKAMAETLLANAQAGRQDAINVIRDIMATGKAAQTETARLLEGRPKPMAEAPLTEMERARKVQEDANKAKLRITQEEKIAQAEREKEMDLVDEEFDETMERLKRIRAKVKERARPLEAPYTQAEGPRIEAEALAARQRGQSTADVLNKARERVADLVARERGVSPAVAEEVARQVVHDVRERMDAALIVEAGRRRAAAALPPQAGAPAPVAPPPIAAPPPAPVAAPVAAPVVAPVVPVAMAAPAAPELPPAIAEEPATATTTAVAQAGPAPAPAMGMQSAIASAMIGALMPKPVPAPPPAPAAPPPQTPGEAFEQLPEAIADAVGGAVNDAMEGLGVRPGGRPLIFPANEPKPKPEPDLGRIGPPPEAPEPVPAWVLQLRELDARDREALARVMAPPVVPGPALPPVLPRGPEFGAPAPAEFPAELPPPPPPAPRPAPPAHEGAPVIPPKPTPVEAEQAAEAKRLAALTPEQRESYLKPKPTPKQIGAAQMGRLTPEQQAAYWERVERERPPEMVGPPEPEPTGPTVGPPKPVGLAPRPPGPKAVEARIARTIAARHAKQARRAAQLAARKAAAAEKRNRRRRVAFGLPAVEPPTPEKVDAGIVQANLDREQADKARQVREAREREALAKQVQRQTAAETGTTITPEEARETAGKVQAAQKGVPERVVELAEKGAEVNEAMLQANQEMLAKIQHLLQVAAIQHRAAKQQAAHSRSMDQEGPTALKYGGG